MVSYDLAKSSSFAPISVVIMSSASDFVKPVLGALCSADKGVTLA